MRSTHSFIIWMLIFDSTMALPVEAESSSIPSIGSRVRVIASQLGEGWHVGMLNQLREAHPCYRILIFGKNNSLTSTLTADDITQIQVSSFYNKGFVGNYDPTKPLYPNEEWTDVSLKTLRTAEEKCRKKEKN